MKLYFGTKAEAQAKADSLHNWLLANDEAYAASVQEGTTKKWASPLQDLDSDGKPVEQWFIVVKHRCAPALTSIEKLSVK
jgi:hypothetical protein